MIRGSSVYILCLVANNSCMCSFTPIFILIKRPSLLLFHFCNSTLIKHFITLYSAYRFEDVKYGFVGIDEHLLYRYFLV